MSQTEVEPQAKKRRAAGRSRPHQVVVRLSDEELEVVQLRVEAGRYRSEADCLRALALRPVEAATEAEEIRLTAEERRALVASIGRVGSNINQIARGVNTEARHGGGRAADLDNLAGAVEELRKLREAVEALVARARPRGTP